MTRPYVPVSDADLKALILGAKETDAKESLWLIGHTLSVRRRDGKYPRNGGAGGAVVMNHRVHVWVDNGIVTNYRGRG